MELQCKRIPSQPPPGARVVHVTTEEFNKEVEKTKFFDHDHAVAVLLKDDILSVSEGKYLSIDDMVGGTTVMLSVNCNDVFSPCADSQDLRESEIENLYNMHMADKRWGAYKWCCIVRNMKPVSSIVYGMKQFGVWDDKMENLNDNWFDENCKRNLAAESKPAVQ